MNRRYKIESRFNEERASFKARARVIGKEISRRRSSAKKSRGKKIIYEIEKISNERII